MHVYLKPAKAITTGKTSTEKSRRDGQESATELGKEGEELWRQ